MSLVDNVKDAVKLVQQLDDVDLMRKMLDVQTDAMKVFEENANLKQEVERLEEILELSGDVFFEANAYCLRVSDEEEHGPFCSQCWDNKKLLVRMPQHPNRKLAHCSSCKNIIPWVRSQ